MASDEAERYLEAAEATLQQLDWCIDYLSRTKKDGLARQLKKNRSHIQRRLREGTEPPPSEASKAT